jgi:REP element-mobilizing transposase RayT
MHITIRLKAGMAKLRRRHFLHEMKSASQHCKRLGFYISHFSLLNNHIHMIAETDSNRSLGQGMRSFGCRFGKAIRKVTGGVGSVFAGRYHLHVLKTSTEVKRALEYVLRNRAKHNKTIQCFDEFSSACTFKQWRELLGHNWRYKLDDFAQWAELSRPQSWLLTAGWQRAR